MGGMLRRLRNDWLVTAVSVTGLSLAIAGCILIWSYIRFEFSYDDYHTHAADIYRIDTRTTADGLASESALCPLRYAPALVRDFPQVIAAVRIVRTVKRSFSVGEKHFMEDGVCYADASLWKVFSFRMLEGDTATALQLPFTMVITRSMAEKYFGREDPLGKAIRWDNRNDYTVTGVVEDPPPNSHFTFRALASFSTFFKYDPGLENLWLEWNVPTYIRLQEGTDPREFELKLGDFSRKYLQEALQSRGITIEHSLRPLRRLHLYKGAAGALGEARDIRTLYSLVAVMFLVILIACFNIINLSLARSGARIPEVRIRKVLGAGKRDLVARFLGESLLLSLAALLLACLVSAAAAPWFRNMTALPVPRFGHISSLQLPFGFTGILPFLAGLVLLTGLLAGTGPACRSPSGSGPPSLFLRDWSYSQACWPDPGSPLYWLRQVPPGRPSRSREGEELISGPFW